MIYMMVMIAREVNHGHKRLPDRPGGNKINSKKPIKKHRNVAARPRKSVLIRKNPFHPLSHPPTGGVAKLNHPQQSQPFSTPQHPKQSQPHP
jgi:hypothetical protein